MDKEKIKERIVEEIQKTAKLILEYHDKTAPVAPDSSIGRVTRMDAIVNAGVQNTLLANANARINRLKDALKRVDNDDFGECIKCGEMIPMERLLVLPESVCCVKCLNEMGM